MGKMAAIRQIPYKEPKESRIAFALQTCFFGAVLLLFLVTFLAL